MIKKTRTKAQTQGTGATTALGIGAVAAMLLCCLGPALLVGGGLAAVGGGLAAVGGVLSSPVAIVTGLVLAGVGLLALLRRGRTSRDDSCSLPPTSADSSRASQSMDSVPPVTGKGERR